MKKRSSTIAGVRSKLKGFATIWAMVLLFGCQTLILDPRGHSVPEEKWIPIPESGERIGVYKTEDLTLAYKMVKSPGQLRISGEMRFADRIAESFPLIVYFHLAAILLDAQGKVLSMPGLTSAANYQTQYATVPDYPLTFTTTIPVSENTTSVAFSYTGKAYDGSDPEGGSIDFWEYPVY